MNFIEEIQQNHQQLKKWRHEFHRYPELAFNEKKTAHIITQLLEDFKVDEIATGIGGTGVVAVIRNGEGPSIGIRADMDALPIFEACAHGYASQNPGVMHACGHDGHSTMALGAAQYLAKTRNFKGSVVFIFQPAEEAVTGAPAMINDGLFDRFPMQSIYSMHCWPGTPAGKILVSPGPVMASVNVFQITIKSEGGHAAMPHLTRDPIVAGAGMVSALQTLVSRHTDPVDAVVLSITMFNAGNVQNVIPNRAELQGTVRFINPDIGNWLPERMNRLLEGIAAAHDVSVDIEFKNLCPPTINNRKESLFAKQVATELLGRDMVGEKEHFSMGSDDFCFYLEEVPGAYIYIGNGEQSKGLHHPEFDFNDDALVYGASFYSRLVETALPA